MTPPGVYARGARWYDALSGEPVYRAGRSAGIEMLRLRTGTRCWISAAARG